MRELVAVTTTSWKREQQRRTAFDWLNARGFRQAKGNRFDKDGTRVYVMQNVIRVDAPLSRPVIYHIYGRNTECVQTHIRVAGATYAAIERHWPSIEAYLEETMTKWSGKHA